MTRKSKTMSGWLKAFIYILIVAFGTFILLLPAISFKDVTNYYSFNDSNCVALINLNNASFGDYSSILRVSQNYTKNILFVVNNLKESDAAKLQNWTLSLVKHGLRVFILRGVNNTVLYQRYFPYSNFVIDLDNYRIIAFGYDNQVLEKNLMPTKKNILISNLPIYDLGNCNYCGLLNKLKLDNVLAFISPAARLMNVNGINQFNLKNSMLMCFNRDAMRINYYNSSGKYWFKMVR